MLVVAGQYFFKKAALSGVAEGSILASFLNKWMFLVIATYGTATIIWTMVLRTLPLSTAYPFIASAFILVPLLGVLAFGEKFTTTQWLGTGLIVGGIFLAGGVGTPFKG